jgi:hypothetical protein
MLLNQSLLSFLAGAENASIAGKNGITLLKLKMLELQMLRFSNSWST